MPGVGSWVVLDILESKNFAISLDGETLMTKLLHATNEVKQKKIVTKFHSMEWYLSAFI